MTPISVVIITRNEAAHIADCIASARLVASEVLVVDSGSDDGTPAIARGLGATVLELPWKGYGAARNAGAEAARHDWILSLDADERLTPEAATAIRETTFEDAGIVYRLPRHNHFGERRIHFGSFGFDGVGRLYHRGTVCWNDFPVHERLEGHKAVQRIAAPILHFGIGDVEQFEKKKAHYALLGARRYFNEGRSFAGPRQWLAPLFDAARSYLFLLGFLDGRTGLFLAGVIYRSTRLKYSRLAQLRALAASAGKPTVFPQATRKPIVQFFFRNDMMK